ncbi:hypothetical protein FB451DRAFT_1397890 [Mycena latifolia]|nr:hypothetical protein FB451DRAFT_1397890 [Mycena latifolia]
MSTVNSVPNESDAAETSPPNVLERHPVRVYSEGYTLAVDPSNICLPIILTLNSLHSCQQNVEVLELVSQCCTQVRHIQMHQDANAKERYEHVKTKDELRAVKSQYQELLDAHNCALTVDPNNIRISHAQVLRLASRCSLQDREIRMQRDETYKERHEHTKTRDELKAVKSKFQDLLITHNSYKDRYEHLLAHRLRARITPVLASIPADIPEPPLHPVYPERPCGKDFVAPGPMGEHDDHAVFEPALPAVGY